MIEYFESRENVSYSSFSEDFGDYVAYLSVSKGPASHIDEDDQNIRVTEADLAVASYFCEQVEEAEEIDWKNILEAGTEGLVTLGLGGQFLNTGSPDWLTPGLITGYFAKNSASEAYDDVKEAREARKEKNESLEDFAEDYPSIDSYEVEFEDLDDLDVPISSVRPGDMDEGMDDVVDSKTFQ
jgi:hypothetical protein